MKKINGFENLPEEEVVEFDSLKPGAYICCIRDVEDVFSKEYLKIKFDIADGEKKGFFHKDDLDEWSNQGTTYRSYKDSASKFFKAFITAIEKSNTHKNYKWDWNEKSLIGRFFVAVFGEEEYENQDGDIKIVVKCQDIRSIQALREGKIEIPPLKKLKVRKNPETAAYQNQTINDDDLPF